VTAGLDLDPPNVTAPAPAAPARAPVENRKRAVALRLTVVARQLWQRFDRRVERIGVSRAKWRLIAAVGRRPGTTQRLIAELLEISEVTAGRLIDRLCADGYRERRENPHDRRANCVYLTASAQPVLEQLGELARVEEDEAFAGLSDDDLARLESLLEAIARNIAGVRGDPVRDLPPSWGIDPVPEDGAPATEGLTGCDG
jgi:MarR family transcriptional regulator for hemolysin